MPDFRKSLSDFVKGAVDSADRYRWYRALLSTSLRQIRENIAVIMYAALENLPEVKKMPLQKIAP